MNFMHKERHNGRIQLTHIALMYGFVAVITMLASLVNTMLLLLPADLLLVNK